MDKREIWQEKTVEFYKNGDQGLVMSGSVESKIRKSALQIIITWEVHREKLIPVQGPFGKIREIYEK